ncbi:MAG: ROK family protein [Nocardioidaceae bacterium]
MALSRHPGVGDPAGFLKPASGIGAGIVVDGRLLRGRSGTAGDIGHLTLDPRLATVCRCGRRGCQARVANNRSRSGVRCPVRRSVSCSLSARSRISSGAARLCAANHSSPRRLFSTRRQ